MDKNANERGGNRAMAFLKKNHPFNNFRLAIDDPNFFFGRNELLSAIRDTPFSARIILGGRRSGKTSTINAIRWTLLNKESSAFPVIIDLQQEQPKSLDYLRYIMISRLKNLNKYWGKVGVLKKNRIFHRLLRRISNGEIGFGPIKWNVRNPEKEFRLNHEDFRHDLLGEINKLQKKAFNGVCFLVDGAEFIVRQEWANDAWSYLRSLMDSDCGLRSVLGLYLSGYRNLKEYQQKVGSPLLSISELQWLKPLEDSEIKLLIAHRCEEEGISLNEDDLNDVITMSGGHPYLTHQILNALFNCRMSNREDSVADLLHLIIKEFGRDFSKWWDEDKATYGFSEIEKTVYFAFTKTRSGTIESIAQDTRLSQGEIADALDVLLGTGVIRQFDDENYIIGSRLFEEWVIRNFRNPLN
jgi:hypothetical protein